MKYDSDTLKWLRDKSNLNVLRLYENHLSDLPKAATADLLEVGLITRSYHQNRILLTEKGRLLLERTEE